NPPEPCTLPPGVAPGTKRTFFPGSDFEVPVPSRRALTGFAIGWVLVGAIIGFVAWIAAG
ncbi:MAG: sodium:solute symporter family protein, partial [Opitutales bacterium]